MPTGIHSPNIYAKLSYTMHGNGKPGCRDVISLGQDAKNPLLELHAYGQIQKNKQTPKTKKKQTNIWVLNRPDFRYFSPK